MINIYTDGACSVNPGIGGWGAVIIYDSGKEELYHNAEDPKEWNNLVFNKTHPKRDEMVEILKKMTYPMVPNGLK